LVFSHYHGGKEPVPSAHLKCATKRRIGAVSAGNARLSPTGWDIGRRVERALRRNGFRPRAVRTWAPANQLPRLPTSRRQGAGRTMSTCQGYQGRAIQIVNPCSARAQAVGRRGTSATSQRRRSGPRGDSPTARSEHQLARNLRPSVALGCSRMRPAMFRVVLMKRGSAGRSADGLQRGFGTFSEGALLIAIGTTVLLAAAIATAVL